MVRIKRSDVRKRRSALCMRVLVKSVLSMAESPTRARGAGLDRVIPGEVDQVIAGVAIGWRQGCANFCQEFIVLHPSSLSLRFLSDIGTGGNWVDRMAIQNALWNFFHRGRQPDRRTSPLQGVSVCPVSRQGLGWVAVRPISRSNAFADRKLPWTPMTCPSSRCPRPPGCWRYRPARSGG